MDLWPIAPSILTLWAVAASSVPTAVAQEPAALEDVPEEHRSLYTGLQQNLQEFNTYLDARDEPGAPLEDERAPMFGAELITANAHRGEELLTENGYRGNLLMLDRLQALGVTGVTVQIAYPLLDPDFPRNAEYLAFYQRLADEIKRRGLTLVAKNGPLFQQAEFARIQVAYDDLTVDRYFAGRLQHVRTIAREVQPDYLTIANEPSSEQTVTGLRFGVPEYTRFVRDAVADVAGSGVLIGAGSGTWDRPDYVQSFAAETDVDYIDLHIYPVYGGYLRQAVEMADIAKAHAKRVVVGEAWLYKSLGAEPGALLAATWAPAFSRDVYSFWHPLDSEFVRLLMRFAWLERLDYVSLFWSKYLFAYADHEDATSRMTPMQLLALGDRLAATNMLRGQLSPTGAAYRELIERADGEREGAGGRAEQAD